MKPSFGKGETVCLTYTTKGASSPTHYITVSQLHDVYYLYNITDSKVIKTKHKANNPIELYKYMEE